MIKIGLDLGYSSTKVVAEGKTFKIPSIVGSYEDFFTVGGEKEVFEVDGKRYLVGNQAIDQSHIVERREDRAWIKSNMYKVLMQYALVKSMQSSRLSSQSALVVSGLPLSYFSKDSAYLKSLLSGEIRGTLNGVESIFTVAQATVVPQPFGALLDYALNDDGGIIVDRAKGRTGVIDVGGKTTNILSVSDLSELSREATSVNVGGWTAVRRLTDYLRDKYSDIDDRASNMEKILNTKEFIYFGERVSVGDFVDSVSADIANQIKSEISQRWGSASQFERIIVSGGGAYLVGDALKEILPQAFISDNPVFTNAKGFFKFAKRSDND